MGYYNIGIRKVKYLLISSFGRVIWEVPIRIGT
jgi:hypothetical protein